MSLKDPSTGQMRVACSVQKSLWSYAVESSLELHRIVDEIYPDGSRLMRFVISDFVGRFLNAEWSNNLIDCDQVIFLFYYVLLHSVTGMHLSCVKNDSSISFGLQNFLAFSSEL